ncbi:MAG: hypothetical protein Q8O09_05195 [Bacillota bacterium]|nr:hypothetical protein [Bacillota bacterium]
MEPGKVSALKIAGTYIGVVVGAGFASGQEILQFFAAYGPVGIAGVVLAAALFGFFGWIIMDTGLSLNAQSYLSIIRFSGGKYLGAVIDAVITFFLFGSLTAMFAGAGAFFSQFFGLPAFLGALIMAIITAATVLTGFGGVLNAISFVAPFLILSAIGVSILSFFLPSPTGTVISMPPKPSFVNHWLISSILYVSYNTVVSVAVLGPLGSRARSRRAVLWGALIGGLGLGVGAMSIFFALRMNMGPVAGVELPMMLIAARISPAVNILYSAVLLAEVYTTAVAGLYGFASRLSVQKGKRFTASTIGAAILAFLMSLFGFSNLVRYLYPAVGIAGTVLLACLVYRRFVAKQR